MCGVYRVVFKKNIKPAIAKIYLKNILELEDNIDYKSKKIQFLVKLKHEAWNTTENKFSG